MLSFKLYIVRNFYLIIYYNFMLTLQATIEMYVNCERCTVFLQLIKNDISIFIVSIKNEKMSPPICPQNECPFNQKDRTAIYAEYVNIIFTQWK